MGDVAPKYVIRGKIDDDTNKEVMARYMAQIIAGVIGIAVESGKPVIDGKPRESWRRMDWQRLCENGTAEDRIYELIMQESLEELQRTFDVALTVTVNGLVAMHQLDFLTGLGSVMANILATEGGAKEYLRPGDTSRRRRRR